MKRRLLTFGAGMLTGVALLWWALGRDDDDEQPAKPAPTQPTLTTAANTGSGGATYTLTSQGPGSADVAAWLRAPHGPLSVVR